jgi:hypothetical protein
MESNYQPHHTDRLWMIGIVPHEPPLRATLQNARIEIADSDST